MSLVPCLLASGCHLSTFPDPNDPKGAGVQQPEVLRRQVKGASDALFARETGGEITDAQYRDLLAKYTDGLLKGIRIEDVEPGKAWEYGEVFRAGRRWDKAEAAFRVAVKAAEKAKNEDRRVNDELRLAEALAHQGHATEAIAEARKTFDTPPATKAPILYGIVYEIAPGGRGQGKATDKALARLVEDSIRQSDQVLVDGASDAGKGFLNALPHHQHEARSLAANLYLSAGDEADAERALSGQSPTVHV